MFDFISLSISILDYHKLVEHISDNRNGSSQYTATAKHFPTFQNVSTVRMLNRACNFVLDFHTVYSKSQARAASLIE